MLVSGAAISNQQSMKLHLLLALLVSASLALGAKKPAPSKTIEADIVIFGGTSGGVAAAVQAKRMGKSVVIAEWTQHLGGLTTGGLRRTAARCSFVVATADGADGQEPCRREGEIKMGTKHTAHLPADRLSMPVLNQLSTASAP